MVCAFKNLFCSNQLVVKSWVRAFSRKNALAQEGCLEVVACISSRGRIVAVRDTIIEFVAKNLNRS